LPSEPLNWYGPRMTRLMAHYGIDPAEAKYEPHRGQGREWCSFCAMHPVDSPQPRCDLEQARAKELEAWGYEVSVCLHCKCAYPQMFNRAGLCRSCHHRQIKNDRRLREQATKRRISSDTGAWVRVPDGSGCTERLPRWSVEWNGSPDG